VCENNLSDSCAYGQWIKEAGKLAFSGIRVIKCLRKINVATYNVQILILPLREMQLPLKHPGEWKQGPPGQWPSPPVA